MNKFKKPTFPYRSDIDGLRAIAVLAVVFYHSGIIVKGNHLFDGGFLGVDIFFVISGYLITRIIWLDLAEGRFQFIHFYQRRIRRILPILMFVMVMSLPFGWLFLFPSQLIDYSNTLITAMLFTSNLYIYFSGQDYAAESALLKPFLHTWSLAVEEQFYVLYPVVLVLCYKWIRKYATLLLILIFCLSLMFSTWASYHYSSLSFYILPTRIWELLAGAFVFNMQWQNRGNKIFNLAPDILVLVGLGLMFWSFAEFDENTIHPSIWTVIPVVGACLVIRYGDRSAIARYLLSNKLMSSIGLISYSFYLWHYPIFAFARHSEILIHGVWQLCLLILLSGLLAACSYIWIEKPFRDKNKDLRLLLIPIVALMLIIILSTGINIFYKGLPDRISSELYDNPEIVAYDNPEIVARSAADLMDPGGHRAIIQDGSQCHNRTDNFCEFGEDDKNGTIYLLGDSVLDSLLQSFATEAINAQYKVVHMSYSQNYYLPGFVKLEKKNRKVVLNETIHQARTSEIMNSENAIVILGGRLPLYLSEEYFDNGEGGLEKSGKFPFAFIKSGTELDSIEDRRESIKSNIQDSIERFNAQGHMVVLMYPIPETGWNIPQKMRNSLMRSGQQSDDAAPFANVDLSTSLPKYFDRTQLAFDIYDSLDGPNLKRVYPHETFCNINTNRCYTHDSRSLYYYDQAHLSRVGSLLLSDAMIKVVIKN